MNMKHEFNYHFQNEDEIPSPQLIYYPQIIRKNIERMIEMAGGTERLWPHIKTHKMESVTKMLLSYGIVRLKCATISECEMAAAAGAKEVLLAYPLVSINIRRFLLLVRCFPDCRFYAIGDDTTQVRTLGAVAEMNDIRVRLLMDIDIGQHRTGVPLQKVKTVYKHWYKLPGIELVGFHCYDGHRHESDSVLRDTLIKQADLEIEDLRSSLIREGYDCSVAVMGCTPSFPSHRMYCSGFLSPGTCVVQDVGYRDAFPDLPFVPGAVLLTRVISRPTEKSFTLDLGTKAVACDPPLPRVKVIGFEDALTLVHNEEHLVLVVPDDRKKDIPEIGTVLYALPEHICPTTALYPFVAAVEDGRIVAWWDVTARDRKLSL